MQAQYTEFLDYRLRGAGAAVSGRAWIEVWGEKNSLVNGGAAHDQPLCRMEYSRAFSFELK